MIIHFFAVVYAARGCGSNGNVTGCAAMAADRWEETRGRRSRRRREATNTGGRAAVGRRRSKNGEAKETGCAAVAEEEATDTGRASKATMRWA